MEDIQEIFNYTQYNIPLHSLMVLKCNFVDAY